MLKRTPLKRKTPLRAKSSLKRGNSKLKINKPLKAKKSLTQTSLSGNWNSSLKRTPLKKKPYQLKRSYIKKHKKITPYRESIVFSNPFKCSICGAIEGVDVKKLQKHEIFFGVANRSKSIEDKMIAYLCKRCHTDGNKAVHLNRESDLNLKKLGQQKWEETYGSREDFRKRYGKSWL